MKQISVTSPRADLAPIDREFYVRNTLDVARHTLGKLLVRVQNGVCLSGRIVEVEAYIGEDDPACHARFGRTERNDVMYGVGGFSYVYFIYGMYNMLNIVTEAEGYPAAVLIRALEPVVGIDDMRARRSVKSDVDISNGPGKLCRAMDIGTSHSGLDMTRGELFVANLEWDTFHIGESPRIGIKNGLDRKWRFFVKGNRYVTPVR